MAHDSDCRPSPGYHRRSAACCQSSQHASLRAQPVAYRHSYKKKCVDDCIKDDIYKFQYKSECLEQCPENTFVNNNDYICRENIEEDKCLVAQKDLEIYDFKDETILENFVKTHSRESNNQDNYISLYNNDNYNLLIFQNSSCVNDLNVKSSNFDLLFKKNTFANIYYP